MKPLAAVLAIVLAAWSAVLPAATSARERGNTGATPRQAVLRYLSPGRDFRIVRIGVAGRFAVVRFTGALMEGNTNWHDDLLVESFRFGWQVLGTISEACLRDRGATHAELSALESRYVRARHSPNEVPCAEVVDRGPASDVAAVRSAYREPFAVPSVAVSRGYALLTWTMPGGGQTIFAQRAGTWRVLRGGGGVFSAAELENYGVPLHDACAIVAPSMSDRVPCK